MEYTNKKFENFKKSIKSKKVAIIGLGVSNIPLLDFLHNLECKIAVFNNKSLDNLDKSIFKKISEYKIGTFTGENYLSNLKGFDIIFRSPSCRPDLPEITKEVERGAFLTSEIELVLELCPGTTIGVTGSDGKTTTTSLIYEILKKQRLNCYLGGNIGTPLFTKISEMKSEDYVVLELSSFQLMTMKVSPNIAIITNISPNHLDIHNSYEEYINAKSNIYRYQTEKDLLVLNYDNEITKSFEKNAKGRVVLFSRKVNLQNGVFLKDNFIKILDDSKTENIVDVTKLTLKGNHNIENACAAIAATCQIVTPKVQKEAITEFKGVNHRLEFIKEIEGIKWYNDSIASSPTRTIAGLNSFNENITLIAGGYDKHLDYTPIGKPILSKVSNLILLGQTSEKIYNAVVREINNNEDRINIYKVNNLEEAVKKAKEVSIKGNIVLFSPASASFDMFKNFEERGNKFKELVNEIK